MQLHWTDKHTHNNTHAHDGINATRQKNSSEQLGHLAHSVAEEVVRVAGRRSWLASSVHRVFTFVIGASARACTIVA